MYVYDVITCTVHATEKSAWQISVRITRNTMPHRASSRNKLNFTGISITPRCTMKQRNFRPLSIFPQEKNMEG